MSILNLSNFKLLYPYYLVVIPIYYLVKLYLLKHQRVEIFSNVKLLEKFSSKGFNLVSILEFLIVAFIAIALATPAKIEHKQISSKKAHSIVIALDASSSMQEQNRFNIAKDIIKEFLKKRKDDEIGLVLFANYAYVASPLTYDKESLLKVIDYLKIGVAGARETALYEALYQSAKLFKNKDAKKVVILLSDGINSVNSITKEDAINRAIKQNLKVYTIGLGSRGDVDIDFLRRVSSATKAKFFLSATPKDLKQIYSQIDNLEKHKIKTESKTIYSFYYKESIYIALALLAILALVFGVTKAVVAVALALVIAIILPLSKSNNLQQKSLKSINIALDLSYFMQADDIYPTRLEFAKAKLIKLFKSLKDTKVALFGFANRSYLIVPETSDYNRLIYALNHLDLKAIKQDSPNYLELLKAVDKFSKTKDLIIITSGSKKIDFSKEIKFIKKSNLNVVILAVGTNRGGVAKVDGKFIKNSSGEIDIIKLNSAIKTMATRYYKLDESSNLDTIISSIVSKSSNKNISTKEPDIAIYLIVALILLLLAINYRRVLWERF